MNGPNGTELLAALPMYAGGEQPREWVIVVRVDNGRYPSQWVCGVVQAHDGGLDAPSWYLGWYYDDAASAMAGAYERAGIYNLSEATIRELAARAVSR